MISWKGFGRRRSLSSFKILYGNSTGGTEVNHESSQSMQPVFETRFERVSSRIGSKSVDYTTKTFGLFTLKIILKDKNIVWEKGRIIS
jgi:hypothetical protein